MKMSLSRSLLSNLFSIHLDTMDQKNESFDNINYSANENLQRYNGNQVISDNNAIIENPYYEADFVVKNEINPNRKTDRVNLDETEVITSTENIYYDI